jgi:hypothetical protein
VRIGDPVDEEQIVPRLLLDDRLEHLDQLGREEARLPRQREQAEGEEGVEALAVAGAQEGPARVAQRLRTGLAAHGDAVEPHHVAEHVLVPPLLERVERQRLAQQRIARRIGQRLHARAGILLGLERGIPERQSGEPRPRLGRQRGPRDHGGTVGIEGVEQQAAEQLLVLLRADGDALRRRRRRRGSRPCRGPAAHARCAHALLAAGLPEMYRLSGRSGRHRATAHAGRGAPVRAQRSGCARCTPAAPAA